jgi:hypothetical protein
VARLLSTNYIVHEEWILSLCSKRPRSLIGGALEAMIVPVGGSPNLPGCITCVHEASSCNAPPPPRSFHSDFSSTIRITHSVVLCPTIIQHNMSTQLDAAFIARLSLHDPTHFSIQHSQTLHRLILLEHWKVSISSKVLELGCG